MDPRLLDKLFTESTVEHFKERISKNEPTEEVIFWINHILDELVPSCERYKDLAEYKKELETRLKSEKLTVDYYRNYLTHTPTPYTLYGTKLSNFQMYIKNDIMPKLERSSPAYCEFHDFLEELKEKKFAIWNDEE